MVTVDDSTRVRQNSRVASRVFEGLAEVITLDQPIRQHRLNSVATRLWQLSERGASVAELVRRLCEEFEVDEPTARKDALSFCEDLLTRGILVVDA